jgi:uncharacterized membrane protein YbaN (DUF454 family)
MLRTTVKWLLFFVGVVSLAIGLIGIVTPVVPGAPFLIIALYAFGRSSPRLYKWILGLPHLGIHLTCWQEEGSISTKAKISAVAFIWLYFIAAIILLGSTTVLVTLFIVFTLLTVYIITRPAPK